VGAQVKPLDQLADALEDCDVIFTVASGGNFVLQKSDLIPSLARGPKWIFDLGVPRNVEGGVGSLAGVTLKDMDDFRGEVNVNLAQRRQEAEKAELIIQEEVEKFLEWCSSLATRPTIKDLTAKAEEARLIELQKTLTHYNFSNKEIHALDAMTKALVRRILHDPLMFTKSCHRHWRAEFNLGMIRRIFGLD
jgi:glutamyl-tRNA reductase